MNITVIGGTGLIGRALVSRLRQLGQDAIAASPSTSVDTLTGEGLAQALERADVLVDVSSSGYSDAGEMERFFEASGARLIAAERAAGVRHHVVLSVVGAGRLGSGYFRAKAAQERIVFGSGLPFTIVRSAPFFEYLYNIVDAGGAGDDIRLPPLLMQPIAADDVAKALSWISLQSPVNAVVEIGGPENHRLPALAEEILTANEDPRRVIVDADATYFGARVGDEPLTAEEYPRFAPMRFETWLRQSLVPASIGRRSPEPVQPQAQHGAAAHA